jgi:hypothetical protein
MSTQSARGRDAAVAALRLVRRKSDHDCTSYTSSVPEATGRPEKTTDAPARSWPRYLELDGRVIDIDARIVRHCPAVPVEGVARG